MFNRPFVKITNLCIPYNLLNIPHMREIKYLISLTPSVGDFDEWAIKLKITTYLGDYSLGYVIFRESTLTSYLLV